MHVEHLILNAHDFAETQGDMPAHHDVAVIGRGHLIERTCGFGTPVGDNRLMVRARQADAADVMTVAVLGIEAAKHQPMPTLRNCVRRSSYIVAKESRSLRCVGDPWEPAARTVSRRCHIWLADHPIVHRRDRRPAALHAAGRRNSTCCSLRSISVGQKNLRHSNLPHTPYVSDADNPE